MSLQECGVFRPRTVHRETNSEKPQVKIRFAFHFVERNNLTGIILRIRLNLGINSLCIKKKKKIEVFGSKLTVSCKKYSLFPLNQAVSLKKKRFQKPVFDIAKF